MARSIHVTRRDLEERLRSVYADRLRQRAEIERLREQLARKRRIKAQVSDEHRLRETPPPATSPEAIPIRVVDERRFIHYPAGVDDVRAVMRRLPGGVLDGLSEVRLRLGEDAQEHDEDDFGAQTQPDPYTGRHGFELIPGVFRGLCLARYAPAATFIEVFGYVYDPSIPDREMWELYLRLWMLASFVHEVAHHYDFSHPVRRGRWLRDASEGLEIYAEGRQHDWTQECVVPFLRETYPEAVTRFEEWIEHHGGVALPLSALAHDPRITVRGGLVNVFRWIFGVDTAVESLATAVAEGETRTATRLTFAESLHHGERYAEALQIIERVLADDGDHAEALTLKADILVHQEAYEQARLLIERVLADNQDDLEALTVLIDIHVETEQWLAMLRVSERALALVDRGTPEWIRVLRDRARARIELGDHRGAQTDLAALEEHGGAFGQRRADTLRERYLAGDVE